MESRSCHGKGIALTDNEIACEAEMVLSVPSILKKNLPKIKK